MTTQPGSASGPAASAAARAASAARAGLAALATAGAILAAPAAAQDAAPAESDAYRVDYLPSPPGAVLEVGGLDWLSDGRLVVATRRGQVWLVENALADDPAEARFSLFAEGLDEGLGLHVVRGAPGGPAAGAGAGAAADAGAGGPDEILVLQRGELTRVRDADGDGRAEHLDTLANDWGLSGNYHEFAYGLPADERGNLFMSLNVSFFSPDWWLGKSPVPWRGWVLQIAPDGAVSPVACGFRSPAGLGRTAAGDLFVTDNQGDWMPVCPVENVKPGRFYGHPASLNWTDEYASNGAQASVTEPPSRERAPAACWLPYEWSRSAGSLVEDATGGRFGPFGGQLFVAELTNGQVLRCQLETVRGEFQGACFPFRQRVGSLLRVLFAPDGTLLGGMTNRGWGGLPPADGIARIRFTGRLPLEMQRVHLLQDGFEITFTRPLAEDCRPAPADVVLTQYDYDYWWEYGSPERHTRKVLVTDVARSPDRRSLVIRTAGLTPAMVARCVLSGVRGEDGAALLHDEFAYTINQLPEGPPTSEHVAKAVAPPPPRESADEGWLRLTYGDALDAWTGTGWREVDAELDPEHPGAFLVREGNSALVNAGAGPAGDLVSKAAFGDCKVHVEFMLPEGGASSVRIGGSCEVLLADGAPCGTLVPGAGAPGIAPALDAYKGAGQWHELDVQWQAPRRDEHGGPVAAARVLRVLIDDVLLHENVEVTGAAGVVAGPIALSGTRGTVALRSVAVQPRPPADAAPESGWIPIFDGKDLEGWTAVADEPGHGGWAVEDGLLTGTGPRSHLFSPRGDYRDVQVRVTARISDGGNSGLYFRVTKGPGWPDGYEAQINSSFEDSQHTGSLYGLAPVRTELIPPGTWFTEEVTCRDTDAGTHVTIALNGVVVTDFTDTERRHASGHIALQQHNDGSVVEFRSIEVRELR